jgi:hypothetical protein
MAIAYPLALPTITGIRKVDFRAVNAVAYSASPFTFDYIQIGTGANATLHKVLQDANTDAAGAVTLEVWPALRGSRTGVVSVTDTVGLFRLASNETGWSSNELANYGITFAAREAI